MAVEIYVVVQVVAEVQVESVLLEERHVCAHLRDELLGVEMPPHVEHHASCSPARGIRPCADWDGTIAEGGLLQDCSCPPPDPEGACSCDCDAA